VKAVKRRGLMLLVGIGLLLGFGNVFAQEQEKPLLDLTRVPPPSGKTITAKEFRLELEKHFSGGVFSTIDRTLPTLEDLEKMLTFFEPFLERFYPGQKVLGLFGLLLVTSWKTSPIVLYVRADFELGILTTKGWYRLIEDPELKKIKIEPLPSFPFKPIYLST